MKKIKQFEIEHLPIEELKPYRLNAKLHPQEQIKKIIRSMELTGFDQPIVVNKKDYSIIKGHGRLEAAIQMGMVTVPVIVLDVSQDVADKARLLDNKSAEGEYDIEKLLKELTRFQDDIDATGYGREELDKLLMELESQTVGIEVVEHITEEKVIDFKPKEQKEVEDIEDVGNIKELGSDTKNTEDQIHDNQCPNCGYKF